MKLTLAEPNYLKDSVSIISELVNEASFKIKPNSIELIAMDPANVAMVIFKLLSSAFVEYNVTEETDLAINLTNLKQILRRVKSSDTLSMEIAEDKLKITLKGKSTRTFYLPIIDLDEFLDYATAQSDVRLSSLQSANINLVDHFGDGWKLRVVKQYQGQRRPHDKYLIITAHVLDEDNQHLCNMAYDIGIDDPDDLTSSFDVYCTYMPLRLDN